MTVIDLPIVGQSYHLKDWAIDCQRTLNFYPQVVESGNAPQVSALLPTPGLVKRFEFSGAIRGLYALNDVVLVVAGQTLYRVDKSNNAQQIGIIAGTDIVYFADNSIYVVVVGDSAYRYDIRQKTLTDILISTGTGFLGASDVTLLDSRFVWTVPSSGQIQWSTLLDTSTTGLNYATAEAKSDNLVRTIAVNGQLWLIGEKTTEVWMSTGNPDLPFQRMSGAFIPAGCAAKNSVCVFGGGLVWLTSSDHGQSQIVLTQGYQTQRISNHAIESEIASYDHVDDAYSFAYQQDGHAFLMMSFPAAKKTWCYDATTGMWHERSYYNLTEYQHEHHRAITHVFFNGEHLVGDRSNGIVYRLCPDCSTDNLEPILRERITPVINPQGSQLIFDAVELILQTGQQENTKPVIRLDWSDDRGKSWSKDRVLDFGAIGEFNKRTIFNRLGQSRNRVFRLRISDSNRLIILGAKARVR
ncbi:hypothetical protein HLH12_09205 [Acinetobacter sp. NIPH 2377]|uniref:packaged DNA stabilization protein n=1 Tax=Acinetobacter terrestris TaxID=2529843 RepID=UPI0014905BE6|nr:packaged DNA stabilization protein [Acinetobacter terrestris]NNH35720.1 hypothetical protein [Acinetobacter terrestris]